VVIDLRVWRSMVFAPVARVSSSYQVRKKSTRSGMIRLMPSFMLFICRSNSLRRTLMMDSRYSLRFWRVTLVSLPLWHSSISDPSDRRVMKVSLTVSLNSSSRIFSLIGYPVDVRTKSSELSFVDSPYGSDDEAVRIKLFFPVNFSPRDKYLLRS
jgi:hypothetical protein